MTDKRKQMVWNQFGASLDMLGNAVKACPETVWADGSEPAEFWYLVFHALFWTELYLYGPIEGFVPCEPFGLEELDPAGVLPHRTYSQAEMLEYLDHCRSALRNVLSTATSQRMAEIIRHGSREMSFEELLWYNMRHVQHHTAQLNYILRQKAGDAPGWVSKTSHRL